MVRKIFQVFGWFRLQLLSADKESCTAILNKNDYVCKVGQMIEDGIAEDKYIETSDNT